MCGYVGSHKYLYRPSAWACGNMGRVEAVLDNKLEERFRMEVAKRYGVKKGNMLKAISEAVEMWISTDESKRMARLLAKPIRDPKASVSVKQHAVTALATTGIAGRELLADIGADSSIPDTIREQAFKAISAQSDR
jgi:hypothetical protein